MESFSLEDDPMLAEIHKRYIDNQDQFDCVEIALNAKKLVRL